MHCLKCGMEIKAPAAFCKECQLAIQNDPVQQDAPIILPVHPKQQADPKPYRHSRPQARQEELLRYLFQQEDRDKLQELFINLSPYFRERKDDSEVKAP